MTAYISVNFSKRNNLQFEIEAIKNALNHHGIQPFVFVDYYKFDIEQEQLMMETAMKDIDRCELLIAETSVKGIGIGIEAGYAKAKHKFICYLRKESASHSTTLSGISDCQIIYKNPEDLYQQLSLQLQQYF